MVKGERWENDGEKRGVDTVVATSCVCYCDTRSYTKHRDGNECIHGI